MPRNEEIPDCLLRIAAGVLLVSIVFVGPKIAWNWIGIVPHVDRIDQLLSVA
jgi:hypothetical protein